MHSPVGVGMYKAAVAEAIVHGGKVEFGGKVVDDRPGNYVLPTIISGMKHDSEMVLRETFAPIVYIMKIKVLNPRRKRNERYGIS